MAVGNYQVSQVNGTPSKVLQENGIEIQVTICNTRQENVQEPQNGEPTNSDQEQIGLKKNLGFFSCIGMLVGIIIGSGIFISPKGVLRGTGSIGFTFIVWILCGVMSLLGALAFAELGCIYPASGGSYMYILEGFAPNRRKEKSMLRPLIPFLVSWQYNLLAKPASLALQGLACAEYLHQISSKGCHGDQSPFQVKLLAACIVILVTGINYFSATLSSRIINIFSSGKILSLGFIIISGLVMLGKGTNQALNTGFEGSLFAPSGVSLAFFSGLWAISGWDNLTLVVKELENPRRDLLRSLAVSITLIVACYILANVAYFTVLSKAEFLASSAVAVDFARKIGGEIAAIAMVLMVASSVFGSALGITFTNTRLIYAAGREGHLWDFVSYLHLKFLTPAVALLIYCAIALLLLSQATILSLISLFGFIDGIVVALAMVALLIVRRSREYGSNEVKFPVMVPLAVITFNVFLVVMPFIEDPQIEYLFVLAVLIVGIIAYFIFIYFEFRIKSLDFAKIFGQKLLNVGPPEDKEV